MHKVSMRDSESHAQTLHRKEQDSASEVCMTASETQCAHPMLLPWVCTLYFYIGAVCREFKEDET